MGGTSAGGQTKKCPDCAETILADAKVCKHCGYRFALAAPDVPHVGARVKVRAGEDDYDGEVGIVQTHLDDDGDGLTIGVIFKGDKQLYAFSPGELTVVTDEATKSNVQG